MTAPYLGIEACLAFLHGLVSYNGIVVLKWTKKIYFIIA